MRLPRLSSRSKKLVAFFAVVRFVIEVIDWFVGKIGYLGVFTSPEDFQTMVERAPLWVAEGLEAVRPVLFALASFLRRAWDAASGEVGTLVVLGVVVLLLVVDAKGLRYRLRMAGRSFMADEVWLSEEDALEALRQSDWAKLRLPYVSERIRYVDLPSITGVFGGTTERTIYGMPPEEKARRKYEAFLDLTLRSFADTNPQATRPVEGGAEYERNALLRFLSAALQDELLAEFGRVPSYKVT